MAHAALQGAAPSPQAVRAEDELVNKTDITRRRRSAEFCRQCEAPLTNENRVPKRTLCAGCLRKVKAAYQRNWQAAHPGYYKQARMRRKIERARRMVAEARTR